MPFNNLNINSSLVSVLEKHNISEPTKIQSEVIPLILQNENVLIQSFTGSGKTLAYLLPIISKIKKEDGLSCVVVAPTHDLAGQIYSWVNILIDEGKLDLKSSILLGNSNIKNQIEALRKKPHIVVGTSGRVLDLIKQKKLPAHLVKTLVIDEADKMLDKNNCEQTLALVKAMLRRIQFVLASATILKSTVDKANEFADNFKLVNINKDEKIPQGISHFYVLCDYRKKIETIRKLINKDEYKKGIIFINNNDNITQVTEKLKYHDIKCDLFYGSMRKNEKVNVLSDFKSNKINFLVASDIASRGLDIDDIDLIINLSLSNDPYDYLHRCGRSGRQEKKGESILIVEEAELELIKKYEKQLNISIISKNI